MREHLNIRLAIQLAAAFVLLVAGVFFWNRFQVYRNIPELRTIARTAEERGRPDRAARLLELYLSYTPQDLEARADYGKVMESMANSPKARRDAIAAYKSVLESDPKRWELRKHIANLLMMDRDFPEALRHLELLPPDTRKESEIAFQLGLCHEAAGISKLATRETADPKLAAADFSLAVAEYDNAIKSDPKRLMASIRQAHVVRTHLKDPAAADKIIDHMVEMNPTLYQVYLIRANLRRDELRMKRKEGAEEELQAARKKIKESVEEDLRAARKLAPKELDKVTGKEKVDGEILDVELLLVSAEWEEQENQRLPEAREYLRRAKKAPGGDFRPYFKLALLEDRAGKREDAIDCLREAQLKYPNQPELLSLLTELLIRKGDAPGARQVIAEMKRWKVSLPVVPLLQAETEALEGKWKESRATLEANRAKLAELPDLLVRVNLLLGKCYGRLGDDGQELLAYQRAAAAAPKNLKVQSELALVLLRHGRLTDAVSQQRRLAESPDASADALYAYARMLVQEAVSSPSNQGWKDAQQALDKAAAKMPKALNIDLLRVNILAAQNKTAEADRLLKEVTALNHPDAFEVPVARALLASRQGKKSEALAILDAAALKAETTKNLGASVDLCLLRLQLSPSLEEAGLAKAIEVARDLEPKIKGDKKLEFRLVTGLAESYYRWNDSKEARRLWLEAANLNSEDWFVRFRLFDLASKEKDDSLMEQMVRAFQQLEGEDGPLGHYAEAMLLVMRAKAGDQANFQRARQHLELAGSKRPNWPPISIALAEIDTREGKPDEALDHYLKAFGNKETRQIGMVKTVVQMLYERQRFAEADRLIAEMQLEGPLSPDLGKLGAEVSLSNANPKRAYELAIKAVPADSKDPQDLIWLGRVLFLAGNKPKALEVFRKAIALGGTTSGVPWTALVEYHVRLGEKSKAEAVINEARKTLTTNLDATLARCYDLVGNSTEAEKQYLLAAGTPPTNIEGLRNLATFYQKNGAGAKAIDTLRTLLKLEAQLSPADKKWARRSLATNLSASNDLALFQEALEVINLNLVGDKPSATDLFTKAQILASKPQHRLEAIKVLENLAEKEPLSPDQEFLLARLYSATDRWSQARTALHHVLSNAEGNPTYIGFYVEQLLQRGDPDVGLWLNKLGDVAPGTPRTISLQARALCKDGDSPAAIQLIKDYVQDKKSAKEEQLLRARFCAQLLDDLGQDMPESGNELLTAAEKMYRKVVADSSDAVPDVLALARHLGRRQRVPEALKLWETARAKSKGSLLSLGAAAMVIACAGNASAGQLEEVDRFLQDSRAKEPKEAASWNFFLAAVAGRRGRYEEAADWYRRTLKENGSDIGCMNNLAVMILYQKDGNMDDAIGLLNKAISMTGPRAELLTNRALVHLHNDRFEDAIKDLTAAIALNPSPVRYFHMAQVYHKAAREEEATRMLQKAASGRVEQKLMLPVEQEAYKQLLKELKLTDEGKSTAVNSSAASERK